jgi:hypothetical protein
LCLDIAILDSLLKLFLRLVVAVDIGLVVLGVVKLGVNNYSKTVLFP